MCRYLKTLVFSMAIALVLGVPAWAVTADSQEKTSKDVAMSIGNLDIEKLLSQPVEAAPKVENDDSVVKSENAATGLPVYNAKDMITGLDVAASDQLVGVKEIKVGSGIAIVATGVAPYQLFPNPNASRLAKRQAYVEAFMAAKQQLLQHLNGMNISAKEKLVQEYYRKDTSEESFKSDQESYREFISKEIDGIIRGYSTYQVDDDVDTSMVYVSIVTSPATRRAGVMVSGGLLTAENIALGLKRVFREIRTGLVAPVGGRIVKVPETDEIALVSFGSAIIRVEDTKASQARERLNAGKQAKARADKAMLSMVTGERMIWQYGTDTRQDRESANFENIIKKDPYGNEMMEERLLNTTKENFVNANSNSENYSLAVKGELPPGISSQTLYSQDGANCYVINVLMQSAVDRAREAAGKKKLNRDSYEGDKFDPGKGPSGKVQDDSSL